MQVRSGRYPLPPFQLALLAMLIASAAALFRVGLLAAPPEFDELYHLLAARGWLETGSPTILEGEYTRGLVFTGAVAQLFALTGTEDLTTGRLLSLVMGCLLPALLFLWLARVAGLAVALVAAGFAVLWPQGLIEAQLLRFYALHVLCFFIGAAAFHAVVTGCGPRRWIWALLAAASWALAVKLQITSVIGIGMALAWAVAMLLWDRVSGWRARAVWLAAMAAAAALVLAAAAFTGILEKTWAFYRWAPGHNLDLRDYPGFYHANLRKYYGVLWYGTPFLAPLALWVRPRLASYCLTIFAGLFLTLSFGGMKAFRYLSYAMPFLIVLWSLALVGGVTWMGAALSRGDAARRRSLTGLVAALVLAAMLVTTGFLPRSLALARGQGVKPRGDWSHAAQVVRDWREAPFLATTRELHLLANLGAYDLLISSSRVTELLPPEEFEIDSRTGRPVVSTPASLAAVLACKRQGLLVTTPAQWDDEIRAAYASAGLMVETRTGPDMVAVRWYDPENRPPQCAGLPL